MLSEKKVNNYLQQNNKAVFEKEKVTIDPSATISETAFIFPNLVVEEDVIVGHNVQLGYMEGEVPEGTITFIRKGARIRSNAVIYYGCVIGENAVIDHNIILRPKTIIAPDAFVVSANYNDSWRIIQ